MGKGLISTDYTPHCTQKLNESVFYDGCNYKDLFMEVRHCDYWNGVDPIDQQTTSTSTSTWVPVIKTSEGVQSTSTSKNVFFSTIVVDDGGDKGDSDSRDSHEHGHGQHHQHRPIDSWSSSGESGDEDDEKQMPLLWFI